MRSVTNRYRSSPTVAYAIPMRVRPVLTDRRGITIIPMRTTLTCNQLSLAVRALFFLPLDGRR